MIHFVTTRDHGVTFRHLVARLGPAACRPWAYESLFAERWLPGGTWIFTDHERLSAHELALASRVAFHLEQGGARVLNRPAQVARRFDLLTRLKQAGINGFSAWRAETFPRPERFPVFLRNEYDHKTRANTPLIRSQQELDSVLGQMQREGFSLVGKLVIEYAGAEVSPGVWQRLQTYCVGGRIIAHTNVVDFNWVVKDATDRGRLEAHPEFDRFLAHEDAFIRQNLHAELLGRVFKLAGIDYGRADFALVDGRPQIYEINTNPTHADHVALFRNIHPRRAAIQKFSEDAVEAALLALDTPDRGPIRIRDAMLKPQQAPRRSWLQRLLHRRAAPPPLRRP